MKAESITLPVRLSPDRFGLWFMLFLCLALAAFGVWYMMTAHPGGYHPGGMVMAVLMSLITLLVSIQLLPGAAYLELTAKGFTLCNFFRKRTLRWAQVSEFSVFHQSTPGSHVNNSYVVWKLVDQPDSKNRSKGLMAYDGALSVTYGCGTRSEFAEMMEGLRKKYWASSKRND